MSKYSKFNYCCKVRGCNEEYAYFKDLIYHLEFEEGIFTRPENRQRS